MKRIDPLWVCEMLADLAEEIQKSGTWTIGGRSCAHVDDVAALAIARIHDVRGAADLEICPLCHNSGGHDDGERISKCPCGQPMVQPGGGESR